MEGEKAEAGEKAAREAELVAKKSAGQTGMSIYLNLPTLDEAVNTLKPWGRDYLTVTPPGFWPAVSVPCTGRRGAAEYPALA